MVVYGAHGFHFYPGGPRIKNAVFVQLEKLAGRWTDYLVVVNRTDEQAAREFGIVPESRIRYVPGSGIDLGQFHPDKAPDAAICAIRQELNLEPEAPLFSMIAEFNPGKRHRDALNAFALLRDIHVHLAFAGSGPTMETIRRLARVRGVADQVHFLGTRPDVRALIRTSVATVLPSEREGLPRSIIESMCLGTPVIGTAIRGITDLLSEGRGLLVGVGDASQISDAMSHLLSDRSGGREMAWRAQQHVARYDIGNLLRLHDELYSNVLTGARCTHVA
jgi:glycosyltransferase involved in cell wall biosynthesis